MVSQDQNTNPTTEQQASPTQDPSPLSSASNNDNNTTQTSSQSPTTNPRLTALTTKHSTLETQLASLRHQRAALVASASFPSGLSIPADWTEEQRTQQALTSANAVIKEHIRNLHRYNEIKDIGQGLLGLVADKRGVRVAEVMEEYGVGEKD